MVFFYLSFVFFHIFSASVVLSVFCWKKKKYKRNFKLYLYSQQTTSSRDDFRTETIEKRHLSFDIKSPYDIFWFFVEKLF